ncbi:hypothetical protein PR202_gb07679 [Eleusine coracana subsp. coracana]|uniref:Uncharacterized protein n=1 Tax=Eleusine coracana subsp. coracana TaxID=191504 RepID=A0AAV5ECV4_ELECO|nr:hypothetical protein PR202_gb07679 [Eleusine coracana subsp. coracana]
MFRIVMLRVKRRVDLGPPEVPRGLGSHTEVVDSSNGGKPWRVDGRLKVIADGELACLADDPDTDDLRLSCRCCSTAAAVAAAQRRHIPAINDACNR